MNGGEVLQAGGWWCPNLSIPWIPPAASEISKFRLLEGRRPRDGDLPPTVEMALLFLRGCVCVGGRGGGVGGALAERRRLYHLGA
jgi:hypothetical protein